MSGHSTLVRLGMSVEAPTPAAAPTLRRGLPGGLVTRSFGLAVLAAALLAAVLASLAYGSKPMPLGDVVGAMFDFDGSNDHLIVRELRLPRTLIGVGVGVGLGLSGAVMQGVTRNPLADPGILGINAGASLAVVVAIYVFGIGSAAGYVWFAFVGAAVTSVVVYALGSLGRSGATPVKLALAGAATAALLGSLTTTVLLVDVATLDQFRFWIVGSLAGRDLDVLVSVLPFLAVGVVVALGCSRALNSLSLGDDVARSLGQHVGRTRVTAAVAVVLLTGTAVAVAGPIGFVGLTVPHVARAVTGPDYRWVLPYSMLGAPVLLLAADVVGRIVARPGEIQVGIVTAVLGAPFFVALVRRRKLVEL